MQSTFFRPRSLQDLRRRHHDAEVDDLVIVAGENDPDNVLADVMHVAFDRRHQDLAGRLPRDAALRLFCFHEGHEIGDRLFHHAGRFDDLGQKHAA